MHMSAGTSPAVYLDVKNSCHDVFMRTSDGQHLDLVSALSTCLSLFHSSICEKFFVFASSPASISISRCRFGQTKSCRADIGEHVPRMGALEKRSLAIVRL